MRPSKVLIGRGFWLQIARGLPESSFASCLRLSCPDFSQISLELLRLSATAQTTDSLLGLSVALSQRQAAKISQ